MFRSSSFIRVAHRQPGRLLWAGQLVFGLILFLGAIAAQAGIACTPNPGTVSCKVFDAAWAPQYSDGASLQPSTFSFFAAAGTCASQSIADGRIYGSKVPNDLPANTFNLRKDTAPVVITVPTSAPGAGLTISGLMPGQPYCVWAEVPMQQAWVTVGQTYYYPYLRAQLVTQVDIPWPEPVPPVLTATSGTRTGAVALSWAALPYVTGYTLYRDGQLLATTAATAFTDSVGTDVSVHRYTITATSGGGTSAPSAAVSGYANAAPTAASAAIDAASNSPSSVAPVIADPNLVAGQSEAFSLSILSQPPAGQGTASVAGDRLVWTPDPAARFAGETTFRFRVTDQGGATVDGTATVRVSAFVPPVPTVAATDGTLTQQVSLSCAPVTGADRYDFYVSTDGGATRSRIAADLPECRAVHARSTPEPQLYYVVAKSPAGGQSDFSAPDPGFPNLPPTAASITIAVADDTESDGAVPTVADPNAGDSFLFAIQTPPAHGSVRIAGGQFFYKPAAGFSGSDSFTFTAADRAGASVVGTGTVSVACTAPLLPKPVAAPALIWSDTPVTGAVTGRACDGPLTVRLRVLDGDRELTSLPLADPVAPGSQSLAWTVPAPGIAKGYTLQIEAVGRRNTVTAAAEWAVQAITLPDLVARTWTPTQFEDVLDIAVSPQAPVNCPLVFDEAAARADSGRCLGRWQAIPPDFAAAGADTLHGLPKTLGSAAVTLAVSRFDLRGVERAVGTVTRTLTVQPWVPPSFGLVGDATSFPRYLKWWSAIVKQQAGADCQLAVDPQVARSRAEAGTASCLVEFTALPPGLAVVAGLAPTIGGRATAAGVQPLTFQVTRIYRDGRKLPLQTVSTPLTVQEPRLNIVLGFGADPALVVNYDRATVTVQITPTAARPDSCRLVLGEDAARRSWATPGQLACWFSWRKIPPTLSQQGADQPLLAGIPTSLDDTAVEWLLQAALPDTTAELAAGGGQLPVVQPGPPSIKLVGGIRAGESRYVAPLGPDAQVARVEVGPAPYGPVDISVLEGDASLIVHRRVGAGSLRAIPPGPGTPWQTKRLTVRAAYSAYPGIAAELPVEVVLAPNDSGLRLNLTVPESTPDTAPLTLSVRFGKPAPGGLLQFDPVTMGEWQVSLAKFDADGRPQPVTAKQPATGGELRFDGIDPAGTDLLRLVALAELESPVPGYARRVESSTRAVRVVKGSPIRAAIAAGVANGPAPLPVTITLTLDRANTVALGKVEWLADSGSGFTAVPRADATLLRQVLPAGTHRFKARLTNRNSGTVSETDMVSIYVYRQPKLAIAGPVAAMPGQPITLTAAGQLDGVAVPAVITWQATWPDGRTQAAEGAELQLRADAPGVIQVLAKLRDPGADNSDGRAWVQARRTLRILGDQEKPRISLDGPRRLEVGQAGHFTAAITPPWRDAETTLRVQGEWTLPDGTVRPGLKLDWTPSRDDLARATTLQFRAWTDGWRASTEASADLQVRLWEYVWPTWTLRLTQPTTYAPSAFRAEAVPDDLRLAGLLRDEGVSYAWTFDPALTAVKPSGPAATAVARLAGSYPVSVVVADRRGHRTTLQATVTAVDAKPWTLTTKLTPSNPFRRVPVSLVVRAAAAGGHPDDRIARWTYSIDGQAVPSAGNGMVGVLPITMPGEHTVQVRIDTTMGASAIATERFTAVPNQPPACRIDHSVNTVAKLVTLNAACRDPDGRIVGYAWTIDGQRVGGTSERLPYSYAASPGTIEVGLTATDDSGATVSVSKTVGF